MENRSDILSSINMLVINNKKGSGLKLTELWKNAEEFRNNTGYVLVRSTEEPKSSETPNSLLEQESAQRFMDDICTFLYDYQMNRKPRWPYIFAKGIDTTGLAECIYGDHSL